MSGVAMVVGGAGGIGAAITDALEQAEMQAAVVDVHDDEPPYRYCCDVTQPDRVGEVVARIASDLGPISVLVNAAGILRSSSLVNTADEDWHQMMAVNLTGSFFTTRAVLPAMREQGYGRIINLASITPIRGEARSAAYAATKGGVLGMTKSLAREVAHHGITVNAIAPGYVLTDMTAETFTGAVGESVLAQIPMRRFAQPGDIAGAAAFLASPSGDYITGQVIVLDGGVT